MTDTFLETFARRYPEVEGMNPAQHEMIWRLMDAYYLVFTACELESEEASRAVTAFYDAVSAARRP